MTTIIGFWALTRHFIRSIVAPPLLTDLGVDFLRRTLASVLAMLFIGGMFLTRALFRRYVDLHSLWDKAAYFRAVEADTLLLITLPMLIVGLLAIIVSPMLFPDDIDYRTLAHLPISRIAIFAAKFAAVGLVALTAVLAINVVISLWFPLAAGSRVSGQSPWMPHPLTVRIGAHSVATLWGSLWMFSAVMALQGLCLSAVPDRWRRRAAVVLQGGIFVGLLASLPYVFRIPAMNVSSDHAWQAPLVWMPPVWFLGIDGWLLDPSLEGYGYVARIAVITTVVIAALIVTTYAVLYRNAETLAFDGPPVRVTGRARLALFERLVPLPPPTRAVLAFALRGLGRSRVHQFVFLLVSGVGVAVLLGQLVAFLNGGTFLGYRPRYPLHAVIAAPLVVALATTLGLRAVFLLPLDQQAAWLFRLTDTPGTRPRALDAAAQLLIAGAVVPALLVALALQPARLGWSSIACVLLTTLANLVLAEIILHDWSRLPFTCSYLPGKRVLAYTLGVLLGTYFVFVYMGAHLLRWSLASPVRTLALGVALSTTFALLRRSRRRSWGKLPLEFEDEDPLAIRSLHLLPDERG